MDQQKIMALLKFNDELQEVLERTKDQQIL